MIYFYIFLIFAAIMFIYMRYEASAAKVERVKFTSSGTGLKIIQLSDIHIKFLRVPVKTVKMYSQGNLTLLY